MISIRKITSSTIVLLISVIYTSSFTLASNNNKQETKPQNEESLFKALFHRKVYTCPNFPICDGQEHSQSIEGEIEPQRELFLDKAKNKKVN